jgi:hypothetical protein
VLTALKLPIVQALQLLTLQPVQPALDRAVRLA